jgi:MoaA/NifB/PqqE/SkfB family radical SAM enzyme
VRARGTLHRHNFRHLPDLIDRAREMGLAQISFLAADVTSDAFNRKLPQADEADARLILDADEVDAFAAVVESTIATHAGAFAAGEVAPGPEGLRRLVAYYRAQLGLGPFPPVDCNAPWMSVMIEANGAVRPCFFHPAVGNLRDRPLEDLLADALPAFRRSLTVATNPTCQRCVCTLRTGLRTRI